MCWRTIPDVSGKVCERVLHAAWLNSHYQTGLKNLLDTAVLDGVELDAARGLAERWQKVDEIPFDFERRRMSVVVKEDDAAHQLICKGALQEILNVSTQVRYNGDIVPLDDTMLRRIRRVTRYPEPSGTAGGGGGDQIPAGPRRRLPARR
ncbi:magnesium-transporting ATPase MgtA [Klebsiella pneumoniae]|uniref:Magnesium-transporting ATPase MgtA n=1 Tax=Klebsiella pneumoniae TaxID=573 RepID=A0A3S4KH33_KLEPN|nr:magnesium-transporting ATPase MgtA [Klebsiella pneumoniae]